jgi:hypothetical protein
MPEPFGLLWRLGSPDPAQRHAPSLTRSLGFGNPDPLGGRVATFRPFDFAGGLRDMSALQGVFIRRKPF